MSFESYIDPVLDELRRALRSVDPGDFDRARELMLGAERIFVAGRGRAGLQMQAFAMRLMHLGLAVHVVGDVTTPGIAAGDILVVGSGSGRTSSLVQFARLAHERQVPVVLITAALASPIHPYAACTVRIDAPTPKIDEAQAYQSSILPMGTVFEQALGLLSDLLILALMRDLNVDGAQMFRRHANLE